MEKIALVKREIQNKAWAEQIRAQKASGLTVRQWCDENNVCEKTYYYHLHKIRSQLCEQIPVRIHVPQSSLNVVIRKGDLTIEIPEGISAETIQTLLNSLQC